MGKGQAFNFYYGIEAEQFSFYRVPRLLIKDERFKPLSSDAKLLYGLMLDRMALSIKNGWLDEENRVYIIYTVDSMMDDLGIRSRATCAKIVRELDSDSGIGLIEKKRRGLGKPDIIYVKNFATIDAEKETENPEKADESTEVQNLNIRKSNNCTSGSSETKLQEVQKLDSSYNNISYTDLSYINHINQSVQETELCKSDQDGMDDESKGYVEIIRKNIAYVRKMETLDAYDLKIYRELYGLICEIVCVRSKTVKINGADYPYELVKSRFLKLTDDHLMYVMNSLQNTSIKVTNMRSYLITALYNAPSTMYHSIQQEVLYDMYGGGWEKKGLV